ncbi:MAG: phosphonate metabolism protein/1,5-bisphosphokinase (PRPP-forming) PhnN, partial [Candidatus Hodarchaeales archaeon]
ITRPPHPSEPFKSVKTEEFLRLKAQGKFALDWFIYGKYYGCPIELEDYLAKNYLVFVNVSRSILFDARKRYPECRIILIEVNPETAKQRITSRKRDKKDLIEREERLNKNISMPDPDLVVKNEGTLEEAILEVYNFIKEDAK